MNQEKFNLNWVNYSDHLREMLHEMMNSSYLTDVTLVCDDKVQFKAHKIVLSACSSVFKSIINDLPQNSSVIYLRGIQHQEMESILEFMYLGVATFYQERMNEFLNVAKNLEVKEISKEVEFDEENVADQEKVFHNDNEPILDSDISDEYKDSSTNQQIITDLNLWKNKEGMFQCDLCESQFKWKKSLKAHIQFIHEGIKYSCIQCDFETVTQNYLTKHTQSIHEGVKYSCSQCDHEATLQSNLRRHIQSQHGSKKYSCNECDHESTRLDHLKSHIKLKHKE